MIKFRQKNFGIGSGVKTFAKDALNPANMMNTAWAASSIGGVIQGNKQMKLQAQEAKRAAEQAKIEAKRIKEQDKLAMRQQKIDNARAEQASRLEAARIKNDMKNQNKLTNAQVRSMRAQNSPFAGLL